MSENVLTMHAPTSPVALRAHELLEAGGSLTDPLFAVANPQQVDLVYEGRRLLLGTRDENYEMYEQVLDGAGLPRVALDAALSTSEVFASELPRDARSIPQVARSRQSESGTNTNEVFFVFGKQLGSLAATSQVLPWAEDISLNRVLARRLDGGVLLLPPLRFVPATEEAKDNIIRRVESSLWPSYEHFGASALFQMFKAGLQS